MNSSSSRGRLSTLHSVAGAGGRAGQPRGPFRVRVTAVEGRNLPDCDLRLPDSRVVMTVFTKQDNRSPSLASPAAGGAVGNGEEANRASYTADSVVSPMPTSEKFSEFHTTDYSNRTYEPYWNSSTEFVVESESESILFELYMKPPAASVTEALKARGIIPKTAAPLAHKDLSLAAAKANAANEVLLRQSRLLNRNSRCPAATSNTIRRTGEAGDNNTAANKGNADGAAKDNTIVGDSTCRTLPPPPPPFPLSSRLSEATTDSGIGMGMGMAADTAQYQQGGGGREEEGAASMGTDHSIPSSSMYSAVSSKRASRFEEERASSTCSSSVVGCRARLSSYCVDQSATPARGGAQFAARDLARASVLSAKRGLARADPTFDANKFPEGGTVVVGIRASMSSPQSSSLPPSALVGKRKTTRKRQKEKKGDTRESSTATISLPVPSSPPRSQHRVEGTEGVVAGGGGWEDEEEKDDWDLIVTCPDYLLGRTVVPVSCAMRPRSWLETAATLTHSTTNTPLLPVTGATYCAAAAAAAAVMTGEKKELENNNNSSEGEGAAVSAGCPRQNDGAITTTTTTTTTTTADNNAGVGGFGDQDHYEVYDCWHRLTDCRKGGPEIRVRIEVILNNAIAADSDSYEATNTVEREEGKERGDVRFIQDDPSTPARDPPTTASPHSLVPSTHGTKQMAALYDKNPPRRHNSSRSVVLPAGWYFIRNCHNTYLCLAPTRALQTVVMGDWCRIFIEPVCDPSMGWDEPSTSTSTSLRTQAHAPHYQKEGGGESEDTPLVFGGNNSKNNSSKGFLEKSKYGATTTITPSTSKTSLSHFFSNSAVFSKFGKHNKASPSGEEVVKGKRGESVCGAGGDDSAFSFYSPPQRSVQIQELQQKIKLSFSSKHDFTGGAGRQRNGVLYTLRSSTSLALLAAAHEKTKKTKKKGGFFPMLPNTNPLENISAAVKSTIFHSSNTKQNEDHSTSKGGPSSRFLTDSAKEKENTPTATGDRQNRFLKASGVPQPTASSSTLVVEDEDDSTYHSVRHNFAALYRASTSSLRSNASPDPVQYSVGLTDIEDPAQRRGCLFEILPHPKHEGRWLIHSPAVGVNLVAEPGGWGAGYTSILGRATDWATFDLIRAPSTRMRTPPHVSEGTYLIETCQKTFICGIKKKITHRRGNDEGVKVTLRLEEREGENAHLAAILPPVYSMQTAFGTFICYEHGRCEARGTRAGAWEKFEILPHPTLPDRFTIYSCNFKTYLAVRGDEMGKIRNSDTIGGDREAFGFIRVDGPLD